MGSRADADGRGTGADRPRWCWGAWPLWLRTAIVFAWAILALQAFVRAPMMGDDIDYFGYALHRLMPRAEFPPDEGFHFLRWTVWGPIWLSMLVLGPGFGAYLFVPAFCLGACAAAVYRIGRQLMGEPGGLLAAALLFFHPLMDDLVLRPMPDIVEGLLVTCGFLLLWGRIERPEKRVGVAGQSAVGIALGALVFLSWVNRPTGLIWFIAAAIASAIFAPRRLLPLFPVALVVAAACFAIEGAVYQKMFGDFWHSIQANLGATDRKGTDPVPFWWLPLRYLGVIASGGALKTLLLVCSVGGGVALWRSGGGRGRFLVAWCVLLYLGVSCAVQSVAPLKPLVRVGERFIGGLAIPLSLLAAAGLLAAWRTAWVQGRFPPRLRRPWMGWVVGIAALCALSSRSWRDTAFLPALRAWVVALPEGSVVAADGDAYEAAFVAAPGPARRIEWEIVDRRKLKGGESLPGVDQARHLLVCRPRLMVTLRKHMESGRLGGDEPLPADLFGPTMPWELGDVAFQPVELDKEAALLGVGRAARAPDFLWFRRGVEGDGGEPVSVLGDVARWEWRGDSGSAGELSADPGGGLAFRRTGKGQARLVSRAFPVPPSWRGRAIQARIRIESTRPEPAEIYIAFFDRSGTPLGTQVLRTYAAKAGLWDFNAVRVPGGAVAAKVLVGVRSSCDAFAVRGLLLGGAGKAGGSGRGGGE